MVWDNLNFLIFIHVRETLYTCKYMKDVYKFSNENPLMFYLMKIEKFKELQNPRTV